MRVRFEAFEVDVPNRRLLKLGVRLPLREQAFQVLLALLQRPGETVTRAELRERLWSDTTHVEFEAGLNTAVSRLRAALSDGTESPRFVETVPKIGYRFIAPVSKSASVAVIPLCNISDDAALEYIAEGLTEDLMGIAGRIEGVNVMSRSSVLRWKNEPHMLARVNKELGVSYLVEGSVRRILDRVCIHLRLVNAADGLGIWSERFEDEWAEIHRLQDRVAQSLAGALEGRLLPPAPPMRTTNALAYTAYLKGHYLIARHSLTRSLEYFQQAMQLDPEYALPLHGASVAHILRALMGRRPPIEEMAQAEALVTRGLQLAPNSSMMLNTFAMLRMFQCRWQEARAAYERALANDPRNAYIHMMYALLESFRNRHARALEHAERGLAIERLDPMTNFRVIQCHYYARNYRLAIEAGRAAIELAPGFASAYWYLGWALLAVGEHAEAWQQSSRALELEPDSPLCAGQAGYIAGVIGRRRDANSILAALKQRRASGYGPAIPIAWVHLGLGNLVSAVKWLKTAANEREPYLANMAVFPGYDPLHSRPEFKRLMAQIGG